VEIEASVFLLILPPLIKQTREKQGKLFGKLFADRGYISQGLFETLFNNGIHLVTGIKYNMKNRLMPLYDRIMFRKRIKIAARENNLSKMSELPPKSYIMVGFCNYYKS
jgi:hypothetical protein